MKTKKWDEVSNDTRGTWKTSKKSNLIPQRWSFFDYSDAYILAKTTIAIAGAESDAAAQRVSKRNTQVTFKNFTRFTNSISEINNTQIDDREYLDIVTHNTWTTMQKAILQRYST